MSNEPFIGKPLPKVGDIIENPDDGMEYKVVEVTENYFSNEISDTKSYRVTLIPYVKWVLRE